MNFILTVLALCLCIAALPSPGFNLKLSVNRELKVEDYDRLIHEATMKAGRSSLAGIKEQMRNINALEKAKADLIKKQQDALKSGVNAVPNEKPKLMQKLVNIFKKDPSGKPTTG